MIVELLYFLQKHSNKQKKTARSLVQGGYLLAWLEADIREAIKTVTPPSSFHLNTVFKEITLRTYKEQNSRVNGSGLIKKSILNDIFTMFQ